MGMPSERMLKAMAFLASWVEGLVCGMCDMIIGYVQLYH
jgi:hypothetical protein